MDSKNGRTVAVPVLTLEWWRQLAHDNPQDLPPRIDQYLTGDVADEAPAFIDKKPQVPLTADLEPLETAEPLTGNGVAPAKVAGTIDPHFAPTGLDFSMALNWLKAGNRLARAGWNGAGQYVSLLVPYAPHPVDSPDAKPFNPYFKMWDNNAQAEGTFTSFLILKNAQNKVFPWFPSMGDLMAEDWQLYVEPLVPDIPPHQLRVLKELEELSHRLKALNDFIDGGSEIFAGLDLAEQGRLREQATYMADYQDVLIRRVAEF